MLGDAEDIAQDLGVVGDKAIEIRNDTMNALNNLCPNNPNITDMAGVDIMGIAHQARSDLTMLANFIRDGVETLNKNLSLLRIYTNRVNDATHTIEFWDWQMKLLCSGDVYTSVILGGRRLFGSFGAGCQTIPTSSDVFLHASIYNHNHCVIHRVLRHVTNFCGDG